jgi:hypothetical protein
MLQYNILQTKFKKITKKVTFYFTTAEAEQLLVSTNQTLSQCSLYYAVQEKLNCYDRLVFCLH